MQNAIGSNYDAIQEAVQREEYQRHVAHGEFEDHEVAIFAWVNDSDEPVMTACAGGTFEQYDDPGLRDEYAGGVSISFEYDRVRQMSRDFRQLADGYDLDTYTEADDG